MQGGGRLATTTAYEVVAEPRPSERADTKSSPATGKPSRGSLLSPDRLSCSCSHSSPLVPGLSARDWLVVAGSIHHTSEHPAHGPRPDGEAIGRRGGREREGGVGQQQ